MRRVTDTLFAVMFAVAAIVTALWSDWIEWVSGMNPDHGDGTVEWFLVGVFGLLALACGGAALARDRHTLRSDRGPVTETESR